MCIHQRKYPLIHLLILVARTCPESYKVNLCKFDQHDQVFYYVSNHSFWSTLNWRPWPPTEGQNISYMPIILLEYPKFETLATKRCLVIEGLNISYISYISRGGPYFSFCKVSFSPFISYIFDFYFYNSLSGSPLGKVARLYSWPYWGPKSIIFHFGMVISKV